jgi:hypothetical protein
LGLVPNSYTGPRHDVSKLFAQRDVKTIDGLIWRCEQVTTRIVTMIGIEALRAPFVLFLEMLMLSLALSSSRWYVSDRRESFFKARFERCRMEGHRFVRYGMNLYRYLMLSRFTGFYKQVTLHSQTASPLHQTPRPPFPPLHRPNCPLNNPNTTLPSHALSPPKAPGVYRLIRPEKFPISIEIHKNVSQLF